MIKRKVSSLLIFSKHDSAFRKIDKYKPKQVASGVSDNGHKHIKFSQLHMDNYTKRNTCI